MNNYEYRVNMLLQSDPNVPRQLIEAHRGGWMRGRENDEQALHESTIQAIFYHLEAGTFRSHQSVEIILWNILVDEYILTRDLRIFEFAATMSSRYAYWMPEYELVRMITHRRG